jgi:hypothetical protein
MHILEKKNNKIRAGDMTQVEEHLPSRYKGLSSNPDTAKKLLLKVHILGIYF